jgi:hypothetical protein
MILWPLMPEHIVSSTNWNITFQQSLEYIMAGRGIRSIEDAVTYLAHIPRWENNLFNGQQLVNHRNIETANRMLKCIKHLQGIE